MKAKFKEGQWEKILEYAYTARYEAKPQFLQEEECVLNRKNEKNQYGYDNVTVVTPQQYSAGAVISTMCSFEADGAPLILLTDSLYRDVDGDLRFGNYYEIVLYKGGINVWQMYMIEGVVKWKKLMGVSFPVTEGEKHVLCVELLEKGIHMMTEGQDAFLRIEDLSDRMNVGITACEGINRFYAFSVETKEGK